MWLHPEIKTLPDIVRYWSARTPDKTALRVHDVAQSYGDLETSSNRIGNALVAHGAERHNVGFIGKNTPELWELWFGTGKAGSALVPLNWRFTASELVETVEDAETGIVFVDREFEDVMREVVARSGAIRELVVFESRAAGGPGLASWSGGYGDTDPGIPVVGEDIALIGYTSGTTGRPKGAMISHEAFSFSFLSDELEPTISWDADDVALMMMPNFHLAGTWVSIPALYHGATVAILPAFEPGAVMAAVAEYRPTVMCLVPTAIQLLVEDPRAAACDFSSLRTMIYAGSPIGAGLIEKAIDVLGCELRQFYGTTETYIISLLRPDDHDPRSPGILPSCGHPVPLVDVRVIGADGADLPAGQVGQVLVHSPTVMTGYYGRPEETEQAFRDGWYLTGDLGYRNEEGYLFLVDRAKDMVVTGGENVYSIEVEKAIQRHPDVSMVAVIGTPDERWGEAVTAFVVPRPGALLDPEQLVSHCREHIASYKVPKFVHITDALPLTPTGKIRKVDLRKLAGAAATQSLAD
jgi:long-chain acyl-CoA synthetase